MRHFSEEGLAGLRRFLASVSGAYEGENLRTLVSFRILVTALEVQTRYSNSTLKLCRYPGSILYYRITQPKRHSIVGTKHATDENQHENNAVIFAEAIAETALETGCILAFVSATSYISDTYATKQFAEVAKLAVWVATVFLSGAATAGPRRWLETSQLFNIDNPISEEW